MVNFFYLDKDPKLCAQYYCDKHVNKILIEILQILSQIHHNFEKKIPPYKKSSLIGDTLAPYVWALSSINNYNYCLTLAEELLKEYKFRFEKDEHKCEKVILWFKNNLPKSIKKKNRTKIKFTNNVKVYGEYFDDITAFRYVYVDFKCKNDKWTKRGKPDWFDTLSKKSELEKKKLKDKILENVRIKLPELSKKHNLKVRRFHSFLRICYDNLFNDKWDRKIKEMTNMFNSNKPLINQLGLGHLMKVYEISNELFDLKKLEKLNNLSLKYRNKLVK
mgnify:FL=1